MTILTSIVWAQETSPAEESGEVEETTLTAEDLNATSASGIEVVVTATANRGLKQSLHDVPQSVSVITREQLDNQVQNDLHTTIRRQAGVGLAPEGAAQNYWNPGFSIRGLGAQRVLTLTNGVRQTGQGIGYGGGFLGLYNSYAIENIEINPPRPPIGRLRNGCHWRGDQRDHTETGKKRRVRSQWRRPL